MPASKVVRNRNAVEELGSLLLNRDRFSKAINLHSGGHWVESTVHDHKNLYQLSKGTQMWSEWDEAYRVALNGIALMLSGVKEGWALTGGISIPASMNGDWYRVHWKVQIGVTTKAFPEVVKEAAKSDYFPFWRRWDFHVPAEEESVLTPWKGWTRKRDLYHPILPKDIISGIFPKNIRLLHLDWRGEILPHDHPISNLDYIDVSIEDQIGEKLFSNEDKYLGRERTLPDYYNGEKFRTPSGIIPLVNQKFMLALKRKLYEKRNEPRDAQDVQKIQSYFESKSQ